MVDTPQERSVVMFELVMMDPLTVSVMLVVIAWYRHEMDFALLGLDSSEIRVRVNQWQTKRFPERVGKGYSFGFHATTTTGATVHLGTASVIKFSCAGGDQHPMGDVVIVAAFSVSVGDGVSEAHVGHFSDHDTNRSSADMLSC